MPAGRPSKYKPEYCDEILRFFKERAATIHDEEAMPLLPTFEAFAVHIGVATQTVYNWAAQFPEFLEAKNAAAAIQHACLVDGTLGGRFVPGPGIFAMKNLMGWRDKIEANVDSTTEIHVVTAIPGDPDTGG